MNDSIKRNELFNWYSFSKYRNQLFGIAIILILIFHSNNYIAYGISRVIIDRLNIGVEMFLFLSGMGLYFSYSKKPTYFQFEKKRFLTVGIVYLIASLPFCIWQNIVEHRSFLYFLFDLSSLSYWFKSENSPGWYVSLIFILYLIYPLINRILFGKEQNNKRLFTVTALISVIFIIAIFYLSNNFIYWNFIERAFTRIPVFIVGCCLGKLIFDRRKFNTVTYIFLFLCLVSTYFFGIYINFRLVFFLGVIPIMFLMITVLYFIDTICKIQFINKILCFFGSITLELYLVHNYISEVFLYYKLTKPLNYLLIIAVSVPISCLLSIVRKKVSSAN